MTFKSTQEAITYLQETYPYQEISVEGDMVSVADNNGDIIETIQVTPLIDDIEESNDVSKEVRSSVNDCREAPKKVTKFDICKENLTIEELASLNVRLVNINNTSLCWLNSFNKLYNYDNYTTALSDEYSYLNGDA